MARGLPASSSFCYSLLHQPLNAFELHARDDGSDIDRFVERRTYAQAAHAFTHFCKERFPDAFLHQKARTGAANLPLIEPDPINQSFHGTVQVGIFEDDER